MLDSKQTTTRPAALEGYRVLDFSTMMAGPYCTRWMADLGAEVIKVEALSGDFMRVKPPLREGCSTYFGHLNAGKRSIAVDLKKPTAVAVVKRIAAVSDVVMENFRPGVMHRLGLDYESLSRDNPKLVYCSVSGYGQEGPAAKRAAYAPVINVASGYELAHLEYQDGQSRPANIGSFIADAMTPVFAAFAIQTALLQRERTGLGQMIDVSLMECMFNLMVHEVQAAQFPSKERRMLYKPLQSADGFLMVMPVTQLNFERLADALGHPEWREHPRLATNSARIENWDFFMGQIGEWTATRSGVECERIITSAGIPCSRYLTVSEAMSDPQFVARGSFSSVTDAAGSFLVPNLPFQMSLAANKPGASIPDLGADTVDVLTRIAGLSADECDRLKSESAIGF